MDEIITDDSYTGNLIIAENQSAEAQSSLPEINDIGTRNQPTTSTNVEMPPEQPATGNDNGIQTDEIQALEKIKKKEKNHTRDTSEPSRRG